MIRGPFLLLAVLLAGTIVVPILLPLAILLGYPILLFIGVWYVLRWLTGRLERPAEPLAIWVIYLAVILTLQGILLCFDTALAGAPPSAEQKQFGTRLAYAGGTLAVVSASRHSRST